MFAAQLRAVESLVPDDVAEYGISPADLNAIKRRLLLWRQAFAGNSPEPSVSPVA